MFPLFTWCRAFSTFTCMSLQAKVLSTDTGATSVFPDDHTFRNGVTTVVDAGSTGWRGFPDFKRRTIDRSKTRVLSLLNIVGNGMGGKSSRTPGIWTRKQPGKPRLKYKEFVVGIKTAHFRGPEWTAVDHAVEAGKIANMPIMVDFGDFRSERPFQELVLKHLRPGDIYTHMYLGAVPMLDENGKLQLYSARSPEARRHLRCRPWWRQFPFPAGRTRDQAGLCSRF